MISLKKLILVSIFVSVILILSSDLIYDVLARYGPINHRFLRTEATNTVKIGDINMAYKSFGTGPPLLLIVGSGGTMDSWNPTLLKELSSKHKVIVFDNRGMGGSTPGTKKFTIEQFSEDTLGLLDTLKIEQADVLGHSMGGMIALELSLSHPDKVAKLVIVGSDCGGHQSIPANNEIIESEYEKSLSESNEGDSPENVLLKALLYPEEWRKQNQDKLEKFNFTISNVEMFQRQKLAVESWEGTCQELKKIDHETLVIAGMQDIVVPPSNSLILAENIPESWLVQIKGAGHGVMGQYPDKIGQIILAFLSHTFV